MDTVPTPNDRPQRWRPPIIGFTDAQRAIYDAVTTTAHSLDDRLIALLQHQRDGANPDDVAAVRRWLSDQDIRNRGR